MGLESPPSIAADIAQVCERVTHTHVHTESARICIVRMRERDTYEKYAQWVELA